MRLSIRAFAAHLGVEARTVNKWEARGSSITLLPDNQALLDTALSRAPLTPWRENDGTDSSHLLTELASLLLAHVAATSAGTTGPLPDQEAHAHQLADYLRAWAADVNRRELLRLLPGVAGGYPFAARTVSEAIPGLDIHPAEHFQQMRKVLIDNDNTFGARTVVLLAQEQINILQRLRQDYRGTDRQKLPHVQTKFAELCGWLYQDSGNYRAAAYWSGRALEWAHMCGDHDAIAYILARKSQLAADMEDPVEAVEAAEAALNMTPRASGSVVILATDFAAQGHALRRDSANCERLYATAQDLVGRPEVDPAGPGPPFAEHSYTEVQRARSLTVLGEYGAAVDSFQKGISGLPRGYRRDCGVYLARKAVAHMSHGDVEQASTVGLQALTIGAETRSGRIIGELKHLDTSLGKFPPNFGCGGFPRRHEHDVLTVGACGSYGCKKSGLGDSADSCGL